MFVLIFAVRHVNCCFRHPQVATKISNRGRVNSHIWQGTEPFHAIKSHEFAERERPFSKSQCPCLRLHGSQKRSKLQ